jgi:hypothetical protein
MVSSSEKEDIIMQKMRRRVCLGVGLLCAFGTWAVEAQTAQRLPTTTDGPMAFGTQSYTVTRVPATSFFPGDSSDVYHTSGSLGRFGALNVDQHYYATVEIPQGVMIDYLGLNNLNDLTAGAMQLRLLHRQDNGALIVGGSILSTPHDHWQTDMNASPIGFVFSYPNPVILAVDVNASPNLQFFGYAEVYWRRLVHPAPYSASFNDVPTDHPFFQFIEALKASGITGGCQANPPMYCPDNPVTRGQMAVFLAKALGLHWPG